MKLNEVFKFGKYKGQTLKEVLATKGSYVGWCLENIPNFHIEPKDIEDSFMEGYEKWKKTHKGVTMVYNRNVSRNLPLGVKNMEQNFVDMLNEKHFIDAEDFE